MNKKILSIILALLIAGMVTSCSMSEEQLKERAAELCQYLPDHELREASRDFMTADFYAVLDTLFNHLPEHEAMDHEWLYYFVTGNGGTIADYEVVSVEKSDDKHAIATIKVRQKWEDGTFDETTDIEEHLLAMENEDGKWLIADFDNHKADCIRHIAQNRDEQARRQAIGNYLVKEIGRHYQKGELCLPTLMIVAEEGDSIWGDFWVDWYNQAGDTLKTVSGGNHAGLMLLKKQGSGYSVVSFEQTVDGAGNLPSARRIFGKHFDIFQQMHSTDEVRNAIRREQLSEYVKQKGLTIRYYQDYGWPAVALELCSFGSNTTKSEITAELAYEGVNNYCHKEYDWSVAEENPDIMYVQMGEETDSTYQVIFRSYTGAFAHFYVDKTSGTTRIVEKVPSLNVEEEAGTINLFDYFEQ